MIESNEGDLCPAVDANCKLVMIINCDSNEHNIQVILSFQVVNECNQSLFAVNYKRAAYWLLSYLQTLV